MKIIHFSKSAEITNNPTNDNIYLFTQFFIHRDQKRNIEIQDCLKKNIQNSIITKIFLLMQTFVSFHEWCLIVNYL